MGRDTYTPGSGGSAGLTRGYIIYTALRCASRHAAIYQHGSTARQYINTGQRQISGAEARQYINTAAANQRGAGMEKAPRGAGLGAISKLPIVKNYEH